MRCCWVAPSTWDTTTTETVWSEKISADGEGITKKKKKKEQVATKAVN